MMRKKQKKPSVSPLQRAKEKHLKLLTAEKRVKAAQASLERVKGTLQQTITELDGLYNCKRLELICHALDKVQKGLQQEARTLTRINHPEE